MKINILCDNPRSWFWEKSTNFIKELEFSNLVKVCKDENELEEADISAFISCNKLVSDKSLIKSKSNIVCHPSDLPKGRGFSPIAWEVLNGSTELTFTLFEANENVDDGKIYQKKTIKLIGTELSADLRDIQAEVTFKMISDYILKYPNNIGEEQEGEPTFYQRRKLNDSELDINKSISEQMNLLRIVDNELYPAFFIFNGEKFVLKIEKET